jgi:2-polyprenyl-6-methoxyphenol hydroxylase-like FAD-dependent oxidoreductase
MAQRGGHAIVIGASWGGLMAARALAEHYGTVTIVERDELPASPQPRKGVPQGKHAHGLLAKGREVLEQLFPGFTQEMTLLGAPSGDIAKDCLWFNHGFYLCKTRSALIGIGTSRPLLEDAVRRWVGALPNIRLRESCDAQELVFDPAQGRVTGVRVDARGEADGPETLGADLVVDASGRGSRSPIWLEAMGFVKPDEEQIEVKHNYMTREYRRKPEHLPGTMVVIMAPCKPAWRGGVLIAQEGERWILGLTGCMGDQVPANESGYLEYARSLPKPEIYNVIKNAEPLSPPMPYHFKANLRRRYERLTKFPAGYLVFGDALCSFNPIYGQGMTVACLEALALRDILAAGRERIAERFFPAASRLIDTPGQIAVGGDLQNPKVEGKRNAQLRFINWYVAKLYRAAQNDPALATAFLEVANLIHPPEALFRPGIIWRIWKGNRAMSRVNGLAETS